MSHGDLSAEGRALADGKAQVIQDEQDFREAARTLPPPGIAERPEPSPDWPLGIFGKEGADLGYAQFENVWGGIIADKFIAAYAGSDPLSKTSQGVLYIQVIRPMTMRTVSWNLYRAPIPGPVRIEKAVGVTLTVVSQKDGSVATFDVERAKFI